MAFAKQSAGGGEAGLAILRIGTGATLFLRHGCEKQPMHWAQFMAHFPDPIHIGAHASFFIAFTSDFICSLLLVLGIWTRWAALDRRPARELLCLPSLRRGPARAGITTP